MSTITVTLTEQEKIVLEAFAKIRNTTVEALVANNGVQNSVREALNDEVSNQVNAGTISEDIKEELVKEHWAVQQKVNNLYGQGTIPTSIVAGLVARAG
jgi:hypothetical protein